VRKRIHLEVEVVDISQAGNEEWLVRYGEHIPVVHLNGREILRHRVDEVELGEFLLQPPERGLLGSG
jgi:hypothetical protein